MSFCRASSLSLLCAAAMAGVAHGQTLFADLNAAPPGEQVSSSPRSLRTVAGQTFFTADSALGAELFVTDGTAAGTAFVADINPGAAGSEASGFVELGNGVVLFSATAALSGRELWRTDGTASGTWLVSDIRPGAPGSAPDTFRELGGEVFFFANDGVTGRELWRTDGTVSGTSRVKDVVPGAGGIGMIHEELCVSGGVLYFPIRVPGAGQFLWRSDGTNLGTTLLGLVTTNTNVEIAELTDLNGVVLFRALSSGAIGEELFRSDGTPSGTGMLLDIDPTGSSKPRNLTRLGNRVLFTADHSSVGAELFRTDGTVAGTTIVADIDPGGGFFSGSDPQPIGVLNQRYVFSARTLPLGRELYVTDGTTSGTSLLGDLWPGSSSSMPGPGTLSGGSLFFSATDGAAGVELWKTDGTRGSTTRVADLTPGFDDHAIAEITPSINHGVLFSADAGTVGRELYASDGTAQGTALVVDLTVGPVSVSSNPQNLTRVGDRLFFSAETEAEGRELYVSDGTVTGTKIVLPLNPGTASTSFGGLTPLGDRLFFIANDPIHGAEPRITDGTPAGTKVLVDSFPGPGDSLWGVPPLAVLGDRLVFGAFDLQLGSVILVTDGTPEGTTQISSINPGTMQTLGDVVLFVGYTAATGAELYRTDGTAAGTELVADTLPGAQSGLFAQELVVAGDRVFFPAVHPTFGTELWVSDGTTAGTHVVTNLTHGSDPTSFSDIIALGEDVLMHTVAFDQIGAHHRLFRSDGTAAGTSLVYDLGKADAIYFQSTGTEVLFYTASTIPWKLWRTDGTPSGTGPMPGADPAFPQAAARIGSGGTLAIVLNEAGVGDELYASAGGFNPPVLVADVAAGFADSAPESMTRLGSRVFFSADDGVHGRELHVVPLTAFSEYVAEPIGHGCAPSGHAAPTLTAQSTAIAPGSLGLRIAGLVPQAPALLAVGAVETHLPFASGCVLYVSPPWISVVLTADGAGTIDVAVPLTPALVGVRALLQAFAAAGLATATSAGLEVVIGS